MAINVGAAKRGFLYNPASQSLGIYVNGVNVADFPTNMGRAYHVNNITGSSGADGLSWGSAMDQVSTAIAASEVYRQLGYGKPDVATNDYVRNTILVQGTGTAYTACDSLPNYCDIIGVGANPRGNGTGIARIDGAGAADAMEGSARGLNMYNLQLLQSVAGSFYGLDAAVLYRSNIESCGFVNNGSGGINIDSGGSIIMDDVHCGHDTVAQLYGLRVGNFNACKVTNSDFHGDTAGFYKHTAGGKETYFIDCWAHGGTYGWQDAQASDEGHMVFFIRCYGYGTASTSINSAGFILSHLYTKRAIACFDNANGTVYNYPSNTQ